LRLIAGRVELLAHFDGDGMQTQQGHAQPRDWPVSHMEVDAEEALRATNGKFQRRFEYMERLAHERSLQLQQLTLAEWEALWCEAKLNGA